MRRSGQPWAQRQHEFQIWKRGKNPSDSVSCHVPHASSRRQVIRARWSLKVSGLVKLVFPGSFLGTGGTGAESDFCSELLFGWLCCWLSRIEELRVPSLTRRKLSKVPESNPFLQRLSFLNPQMFFRNWLSLLVPRKSPSLFVTGNSGRNFNFRMTARQFFKSHFVSRKELNKALGSGTAWRWLPEENNKWQSWHQVSCLGRYFGSGPCWLSSSAGAKLSRFAVPRKISPSSKAGISTSKIK